MDRYPLITPTPLQEIETSTTSLREKTLDLRGLTDKTMLPDQVVHLVQV